MTNEPREPSWELAAIHLMREDAGVSALLGLARYWERDPDPGKREAYALMVELAGLEQQRRERTRLLTKALAPKAWRTLIEAGELPEEFDPWTTANFRTVLHQLGVSAAQDYRVPHSFPSTRKMTEALPAEAEVTQANFIRHSKRAYYVAAGRCWGPETDTRLSELAKKYRLAITELIDTSTTLTQK